MFLPALLLAVASTCGDPGVASPAQPAAESASPAVPSYYTGADATKWPDPSAGSGFWTTPSVNPSDDSANYGSYDLILQILEAEQTWSSLQSCLVALSWTIGIAMLVAGTAQPRSGRRVWLKFLAIVPLTLLSFWAYGFAIGFGNWFNGLVPPGWYAALGPGMSELNAGIGIGGNPATSEYDYGLSGTTGFFFHGFDNGAVLCMFCMMWAQFCVAVSLPTAALAERWSWKSVCMFAMWVALPYSLLANWIWGGGWLTQAGRNWGLGHGVVDFAGSGLIYGLGGIIALAGCLAFGRCPGKSATGKPRDPLPLFFQLAPMGFLILLGPRVDPSRDGDGSFAGADVNMNLAIATAATVVAIGLLFRRRKLDFVMIGCGGLSGLAAIGSPCAFVDTAAAAAIGGVAGIVFMACASFLERRGIEDVIRAVSAFGAGGLWGMIALGLFANGKYGHGWNGVVRERIAGHSGIDGVRELFYGDASQLAAQVLGVSILLAVGFGGSFLMFKMSNWVAPTRLEAKAQTPAQNGC